MPSVELDTVSSRLIMMKHTSQTKLERCGPNQSQREDPAYNICEEHDWLSVSKAWDLWTNSVIIKFWWKTCQPAAHICGRWGT